MTMRGLACSIAGLFALCACSNPPRGSEEQIRRLRTIEVLAEGPPSNFAYVQNNTTMYAQPSVGMSLGAGVAINVVANLVVAGIEYAATATAREAQVPVGQSIQDMDLRATAFGQLQALTTTSSAPTLTLSGDTIPKPPPIQADNQNSPTGTVGRAPPPDPLQPLVDRAKASSADATLYIRVIPLFRTAAGNAVVQSSAWLYDKSGQALATRSTQFFGPVAPDMSRPEIVRWWADGRYRRFIAHGIRAVMLPLSEDITKPGLYAQRHEERQQSMLRIMEEQRSNRQQRTTPDGTTGNPGGNASRMRSTVCSVDSDDARVVYRYERIASSDSLAVMAYCPDEPVDSWVRELIPGISWATEAWPTSPTVVTTAAGK